ncbi:hypothetical protein GCM10009555_039200 [Acrocarpospora macrocephala]|uniref:NAD(P)-binding domain-containing protein n=1 Tax=Acrocarpospora macrocephala TaxID=150177 RepID=A0A5M3WME6_9ACTN|nr:NmrA family NAD(P)-binding protein [Acrocarpospora macrocephala]GES09806.1 hypothetical protein Amac_034020 [Acrocarpospora macrocephala]
MTTQTQNTTNAPTVLLIGATGSLGELIARELLQRGAQLRLLVRPKSRGKLAEDVARAAEVLDDAEGAFEGVGTVVSAVQGSPSTIVDAQLEWLRAAREAGVRRFIPSDYSMNFFGLDQGDNIPSDHRREFARRAEDERGDVEIVHVLNGAFLDRKVLFGFLGAIDLDKDEAYLWGDGDQKMGMTTYADTAAYIAEAALDERPVPEHLFVAAEEPTFHELVAETEAGLGRKLTVKTMGSLSDLDDEIARRQQENEDMYSYIPLMYWRAMLSGKGKLGELSNSRYPSVQPIGVREYAQLMAAGQA